MLDSPLILPLGLHTQAISDTNKHKGWPTGYCDDLLEAALNFELSLFSVDYAQANAKLALSESFQLITLLTAKRGLLNAELLLVERPVPIW